VRHTILPIWFLSLALPATADVHVVDLAGGGDFLDLQPAIDAAVDGDLLLVKAGSLYSTALIDGKGLTIVAEDGVFVFADWFEVRNLPLRSTVMLAGMRTTPSVGQPVALRLVDNEGAVRLVDMELYAPTGVDDLGAYVDDCSDVVFTRCKISGSPGDYGMHADGEDGHRGMEILFSRVALYDTELRGGWGGDGGCALFGSYDGGEGGPACYLAGDSFLFAMGGLIQGGRGGDGESCNGNPAHGGDGGDGLQVATGSEAHLADVLLAGGTGGLPDNGGQTGDDGVPLIGSANILAEYQRTLSMPAVVREGIAIPVDLSGQTGDVIYLAQSRVPGFLWLPGVCGVWALHFAAPVWHTPAATLPAGGALSTTWPGFGLKAGKEGRLVHLQILAHDSTGEQVLGSPHPVAVIDSSF